MAAASRALMYPYDISLLHMIMHKFPDFEIIEVVRAASRRVRRDLPVRHLLWPP